MIYLDHAATSWPKPQAVRMAAARANENLCNPGRGGYPGAMNAAKEIYRCRELAAAMFGVKPEEVVFTPSCTFGLNAAIATLVRPGDPVVISGFEHNAVLRPLHARGAWVRVAGKRLFDKEDTLNAFRRAIPGSKAVVCTHVSNVFGYMLPLEEIAALCQQEGVPLIVDAAQSAGTLPLNLEKLGAAFIAMPGHKGLLGPMGTGILLCGQLPDPLVYGGTGVASALRDMPDFLPERMEAGTVNVSGICGLAAGLEQVRRMKPGETLRREQNCCQMAAKGLRDLGFEVFSGPDQAGVLSFRGKKGCEELAQWFGRQGIWVRAGLHCAPLAHESAGTFQTGTVRLSFGPNQGPEQIRRLLSAARTGMAMDFS